MFTRRVGLALALVLTLALGSTALAGDPGWDNPPMHPESNQPENWEAWALENGEEWECEKIENPAYFVEDGLAFYTMPDPDAGYVWRLLKVKAGTVDTLYWDPVPGESYPSDRDSISHIIQCQMLGDEELTVSKTAVTYFERTHEWDIDKGVATENEHELDGFPKIWLDGPGDEGDETATWTVDVTYEGYEDSDFNVSGMITIENTGGVDAVITSVDDVLADEEITVDCDVGFPYTLPVGETLICTYDEDGFVEGFNEVTVTTELDEYVADAEIVWSGDPDEEFFATVNIKDISDLFGEVDLGSVTAPNGDMFTYDEDFAWADYDDQCDANLRFENTASIVETGQSAEAVLLVNVRCEELTVDKTAETSFTREHFWDIAKWVETDFGHELDGFPKIWLYTDGSGDETATWIVDVTYEGFQDSDFNVSGVITITNTGTLDAVIMAVDDVLGDTPIAVDCGEIEFPYTLEVGATLTCTYSEDGYVEGFNEVTVTTERDEYTANAEIIWGDPDPDVDAMVEITDTNEGFAAKYGKVSLNAYDYEEGAVETFTYDEDFAWVDYGADGCGSFTYDNTATIVETDQSANATLKVNVQCFIGYETAYAKGDDAICFIAEGFGNWGWTNPIEPGEYTWDLWAGAGQCDTDKGTLVGTVTVVYDRDDGYVTVEYNLFEGYTLEETHVYAGYDMFPQQQRGRRTVDTVAPGQYYNDSPFDGSEVYVIAHAVVGMPDPEFGP